MKYLLTLLGFILAGSLSAQRTLTNINKGWEFSKTSQPATKQQWQSVNLPHCWNIEDVMDDVPGYYRGEGYYKRNIWVDQKYKSEQLFLLFEGANQVAEVFVNGQKAGEHTGGYAAFYVSISPYVQFGKQNEILVKVDNSHNQDIAPLSADFTFYGGLYRDVWLLRTNQTHFSVKENTQGIYITTPSVTEEKATVQVRANISSAQMADSKVKMNSVLVDAQGKTVGKSAQQLFTILPASKDVPLEQSIEIPRPSLWSPEMPYLYSLQTRITDAVTGKLLDQVTNPVGFRWFHFDAAKGFFLNGKPYKLIGTSRHQDYPGMGNALPDSLAVKDIQLLKQMGGNFLRVAHYPQDPSVLSACDRLGILTSVEIPLVNEISETAAFKRNAMDMQVEMIRQHYNHPSVIIWCYMNEILLRPHYGNDKEKQQVYFKHITALAKSLDSITRKTDPSRYTMMAYHGDYNRYKETGLVDIPMIAGWNLYSGWYGSRMQDFPAFLDSFHKRHPDKIMVVSEYGADADPRIRSMSPVRFDKSVEYTTRFHAFYLTEMQKRPFVAAAMIWNLADFNSETRTESMPHINNKGLMEWDRTSKDPYQYYKTQLSKKPLVKILGTNPAIGKADSVNKYATKLVQVATNLDEIELFVNGVPAGSKQITDGLGEWMVTVTAGNNVLEAKAWKEGKLYSDKAIVPFAVVPDQFKSGEAFRKMNILLGANRYFIDDQQKQWVPDQAYKKGSWGYVGGKLFRISNNNRLPYGTDKNIIGTDNDPIYQTQQVGIEKYKLDVPKGEYELTLHFAELQGGAVKDLPYNLTEADRIEPRGKRIFNVYVNAKLLLDNFDIAAQYGAATAVVKTTRISVGNDEGIEISFEAIEGAPVLNALQVEKLK